MNRPGAVRQQEWTSHAAASWGGSRRGSQPRLRATGVASRAAGAREMTPRRAFLCVMDEWKNGWVNSRLVRRTRERMAYVTWIDSVTSRTHALVPPPFFNVSIVCSATSSVGDHGFGGLYPTIMGAPVPSLGCCPPAHDVARTGIPAASSCSTMTGGGTRSTSMPTSSESCESIQAAVFGEKGTKVWGASSPLAGGFSHCVEP
jgi:hypothetical protein